MAERPLRLRVRVRSRHRAAAARPQRRRAVSALSDDPHPNFGFMSPENSRRARALPVWATLRAYGRSGYREMVERHLALARHLADRVDAAPELERLADVPLNIVCFRAHPPGVSEEATQRAQPQRSATPCAPTAGCSRHHHLRRQDRAATGDRQLADRQSRRRPARRRRARVHPGRTRPPSLNCPRDPATGAGAAPISTWRPTTASSSDVTEARLRFGDRT